MRQYINITIIHYSINKITSKLLYMKGTIILLKDDNSFKRTIILYIPSYPLGA
jgi:hypothetical protein